jgi:hypothetical protein
MHLIPKEVCSYLTTQPIAVIVTLTRVLDRQARHIPAGIVGPEEAG